MVRVSAAVVPHDRANVFRNRIQILDQVLDRFVFQVGLAFDRVVQVRDVRLMMLGVMDLHRLRVDVRLERVVIVR